MGVLYGGEKWECVDKVVERWLADKEEGGIEVDFLRVNANLLIVAR